MSDKTLLQEMIDNAVHFGHKCQKWNPKMKSYIYTKKYNIHIFDLNKTAICLEKACEFLKKLKSEGKVVLFVSTKPQSKRIIEEAAKRCSIPYVTEKWISGFLTNFDTVKKRIRYLHELKEAEKTGDLEKYTKKEMVKLLKDGGKLEIALGGVKELKKLPDALFITDTVRDHIAVKEANKLKIPIVGIVDTNADPTTITYPIPGNDDAIKSLQFIIGKITEAMM